MGDVPVALGDDFVLREAGPAAGAPRHDVAALVDPTIVGTGLQEMPDRIVVLVGLRVVRVVPVHEKAEPLRLLGYLCGEVIDPGLAVFDELADSVLLDVTLRFETFFFFDFDLDPQPLTVEAVLEPLAVALHVAEPQEQVLVGPAPCVVNSHGVVGGDGPVDEREFFLFIVVQLQVARCNVVFFPPLENCFLVGDEIDFGVYLVELAGHVDRSCHVLESFIALAAHSSTRWLLFMSTGARSYRRLKTKPAPYGQGRAF